MRRRVLESKSSREMYLVMEPSLNFGDGFTTPNGLTIGIGNVVSFSELEYDDNLNEDGFYVLTFIDVTYGFYPDAGFAYFPEAINSDLSKLIDIPNPKIIVYNTADYNFINGNYQINPSAYYIHFSEDAPDVENITEYMGHSIGRIGITDSKGKEYKFEFRFSEPGNNFLKVQFLMPSGEPVGFGTVNNNEIQPISGLCISNDYKSSVKNQYMSLYGRGDTSSGTGDYPFTCAERMYQLASLDGYWNSDNSIGTTIDEVILNKGNYMSFLGTVNNEYGFCYPIYLPDLRDNGVLSSQNLAIANSYKMTDWHICFASFIENTNYNPSRWNYMEMKEQYEIGQTIKSVTYDNSTGLITMQFV